MTNETRQPIGVLHIDSSSRYAGSTTRALGKALVDKLVDKLRQQTQDSVITTRDVAEGLPFIDEQWVGANFTPADQRTEEQDKALALSNSLVQELKNNDVIVMAVPIYNFGIPASLKAWVDLVARAGATFRYTENGPVALLENKKAIIVIASGGTKVGSDIDFASGYLRHVLGFIGIHDVEIISAERLNMNSKNSLATAHKAIDNTIQHIQVSVNQAA